MGSNILNCSFTALYRSAEFEQEVIGTKEWQPDHFGLCEKSKYVICQINYSTANQILLSSLILFVFSLIFVIDVSK